MHSILWQHKQKSASAAARYHSSFCSECLGLAPRVTSRNCVTTKSGPCSSLPPLATQIVRRLGRDRHRYDADMDSCWLAGIMAEQPGHESLTMVVDVHYTLSASICSTSVGWARDFTEFQGSGTTKSPVTYSFGLSWCTNKHLTVAFHEETSIGTRVRVDDVCKNVVRDFSLLPSPRGSGSQSHPLMGVYRP